VLRENKKPRWSPNNTGGERRRVLRGESKGSPRQEKRGGAAGRGPGDGEGPIFVLIIEEGGEGRKKLQRKKIDQESKAKDAEAISNTARSKT